MNKILGNVIDFLLPFTLGLYFAIGVNYIYADTEFNYGLVAETVEETLTFDGYEQKLFNGLYEVHVYETPEGLFGYQIIQRGDRGEVQSYGFGPEATDRTFVISPLQIDFGIASSSDEIKTN